MHHSQGRLSHSIVRHVVALIVALALGMGGLGGAASAQDVGMGPAPLPLVATDQPVARWFVFKFNTAAFPGCGTDAMWTCPFGGAVQEYHGRFSQQFVAASNVQPALTKGEGCLGMTATDPVSATFRQAYEGSYFYVLWNDQFHRDPPIAGCSESCSTPCGHSKGMVVWNAAGEGFALQVSTPSWSAAGSRDHPRQTDGNTLGCIADDNVQVSQHLFAVQLRGDDLSKLLVILRNASVVTDVTNPQIVRNGGPVEVQGLAQTLGTRAANTTVMQATLSSGVVVLSKPSQLHVPPWQLVSAALEGTPLRTATWWAKPQIASTTDTTALGCWRDNLGTPGAVAIATSGQWEGQSFSLTGGPGTNHNHAKSCENRGLYARGLPVYAFWGSESAGRAGRGGWTYVCQQPERPRGPVLYRE